MYTPLGPKQGKWLPIAALCCLAIVGFLIAVTIVLALIPIYIPHKDVTPTATPNDNGTVYAQYEASATEDQSVSGVLSNTDAISTALGLGSSVGTVSDAFAQGTFSSRRRRSNGVSREKRDLKVVISIAIKYAIDSRCNNGPCLATLRSKLITKLQKAGNIANFPCQIQTVDENNATVTKNFNIAATFLGFLDSSVARIGFGSVKSLIFVAAQSGAFNDPKTWTGGIIPFGKCTVVIPASITVTLARTPFEVPLKIAQVYGTLALGSGSSPFTFNYPTNIIAYSGAVIQLLSTSKTLIMPLSSIVTLRTGASFSSSNVVIQASNSSSSNNSVTLSSASGPLTCGLLPSGELLSFNSVTVIAINPGSILSGGSFLGGIPPSPDSCSASSPCDLYVAPGCTLSTSDLNGVVNMNFAKVIVRSGATLLLGKSGSANGIKFMYPVALDVFGTLSFVGTTGAGIYVPGGSYVYFWSGSSFISTVTTFIQTYDPTTLQNIGASLTLVSGFSGPYFIVISITGTITGGTTIPTGITTTTNSVSTTTNGMSTSTTSRMSTTTTRSVSTTTTSGMSTTTTTSTLTGNMAG